MLNPKINKPKILPKLRPKKRLPVTEAPFSTKVDLVTTLANYNKKLLKLQETKKTLITCHGHAHPRYSYLPIESSILLDINPMAYPDLIGDIRHHSFMHMFPPNYFDTIFLLYTPPPSPLAVNNKRIWVNLHYILKKHCSIRCNYILHVFGKKHVDLSKAKQTITKYFEKAFKVSFEGNWTILTKYSYRPIILP